MALTVPVTLVVGVTLSTPVALVVGVVLTTCHTGCGRGFDYTCHTGCGRDFEHTFHTGCRCGFDSTCHTGCYILVCDFFCGQYVKLSVNALHSKQIQRKSRSIESNPISLCIVLADIIHTTSMSHVVIEICSFS